MLALFGSPVSTALVLVLMSTGTGTGTGLPAAPLRSAPLEEREAAADKLLEKAESLARKGRYKDARRTYKKLARDFEETYAGGVGFRRSESSAYCGWAPIVENGPSENRIDVVLMGDGYELEHQKAFDKLADDIPRLFERQKAFREYYGYFNFARASMISAESGVDGFGREYDTALGGKTLNTFAGHVGVDTSLVREALDEMPSHDSLAIVYVKLGVLGVGGSGVAVIGGRSASTTLHEFGHAFGRLGDEYSSETHKRGSVRRSVNVSDTDEPADVPWAHWLEAKIDGIGIHEGAAGQAKGAFKPTSTGCTMMSGGTFCRVCREALVLRMYETVDPIDAVSPEEHGAFSQDELELKDSLEFELRVLEPASHDLQVAWYMMPESDAPRAGGVQGTSRYGRSDRKGRAKRGRLSAIHHSEPVLTRKKRGGVHRFELAREDLAPGRYRLIVRVKDDTLPRGEKIPWVLLDESGMLESERGWWIRVP